MHTLLPYKVLSIFILCHAYAGNLLSVQESLQFSPSKESTSSDSKTTIPQAQADIFDLSNANKKILLDVLLGDVTSR